MQTVLVIEDNKPVMMANERVLTKAGYHVLGAADGEEALLAAQRSIPDLILLDMMLPKLSGEQVLRSLKGNPATAKIPVIIVTSLSQKNEEGLRDDGAAAFLDKNNLLNNSQFLVQAAGRILGKVT
jgi:CheY-like chemotaxis protein